MPVFNKGKFTIGNQQVKKQYGNALEALTLGYRTKTATLQQCADEGFTVKGYLRSKAVALVEEVAPARPARKKGTVAKPRLQEPPRPVGESPLGADAPQGSEPPASRPQWKWYWKKK